MRTGNDPEQPAQVQRRTDMPAFYAKERANGSHALSNPKRPLPVAGGDFLSCRRGEPLVCVDEDNAQPRSTHSPRAAASANRAHTEPLTCKRIHPGCHTPPMI